jgi:hypothetical protein
VPASKSPSFIIWRPENNWFVAVEATEAEEKVSKELDRERRGRFQ